MAHLLPLQALRLLTSLAVSLADPGWCRLKLRPGWPACLSRLTLGSPAMEQCQLQGVSAPFCTPEP